MQRDEIRFEINRSNINVQISRLLCFGAQKQNALESLNLINMPDKAQALNAPQVMKEWSVGHVIFKLWWKCCPTTFQYVTVYNVLYALSICGLTDIKWSINEGLSLHISQVPYINVPQLQTQLAC